MAGVAAAVGAPTADEGQPYDLWLTDTAAPTNAVASWSVDWDGPSGSSAPETFSGSATGTHVTHTYAPGTASAVPQFVATRQSGATQTSGVALDPTFDHDGRSIQGLESLGFASDTANAVAVQPDGKIVVAGYANEAHSNDGGFSTYYISRLALARVTADGALDPSFGNQGFVVTSSTTNAGEYALSVVSSNRTAGFWSPARRPAVGTQRCRAS